MNWIAMIIVIVAVGLFLALSKGGQISAKDAAEYLKQGAQVVDVRTAGEFNAGHLANSVNIPLDSVAGVVPQKYPDKSRVLLLHCASGMRSGLAQKKLRRLGYANVFNLGSYDRAGRILGQVK